MEKKMDSAIMKNQMEKKNGQLNVYQGVIAMRSG